ncbi:developmental regulator flba [Gigaspora margarita]|uniref:Developmental regulator flba n=1 Tax=Gigaspora margarita TaxID=4874 RepID=A0A8H4AQ20_GIGMA|nr:developmental regulator flba [Gigaspora margarita]
MLKLGLKLLVDKKRESKSNSPTKTELPSALPAFEWQVTGTGDSGLGDFITKEKETMEKETISLPEDAIFGTTNERKIVAKRIPPVNNNRPSNAESNRLRLLQIIENEDARNNFQDYLKSQYCEENLDFYMDVVQYRELFDSSDIIINDDIREICSTAKYIWNYYLDSDTSSKPLNVPQDLANQCRQKIDSKIFTNDIFDKLQQHCFDLMVQDSLPKFLRRSIMHENFSSSSNSSITSSHLKPSSSSSQKPFFGPRRSISSGSLRAKMASTLASMKTSGFHSNTATIDNNSSYSRNIVSLSLPSSKDRTLQTIMNQENISNSSFKNIQFVHENRLNNSFTKENRSNSSFNNSFKHENRSNSSVNSSFNQETKSNSSFNHKSIKIEIPESNRSSTVSTDSSSSSPSTSSSTNSISSRISLSNITRRVLTHRRNSTSLTAVRKPVEISPCTPVSNCDECDELDLLSRDKKSWHINKLRRNMSIANFQSDSKSRPSIVVGGQVYVAEKILSPIPAAI